MLREVDRRKQILGNGKFDEVHRQFWHHNRDVTSVSRTMTPCASALGIVYGILTFDNKRGVFCIDKAMQVFF